MDDESRMRKECYACLGMQKIPLHHIYIKCTTPDPAIKRSAWGEETWFNYPDAFDPVWKTKLCKNYVEAKK